MPGHPSPAIKASGLVKRYGTDVIALDGHRLRRRGGNDLRLAWAEWGRQVDHGQDPDHAVRPDSGSASSWASMSLASPNSFGGESGSVGQRIAVDPDATGRENLELQGMLYGSAARRCASRIDALLGSFGLIDVASRIARTYSGGMQRKLDVAMGLVHRPARALPGRANHRPRSGGTGRAVGRDRPATQTRTG